MQIESLELKNFRNYEKESFVFDPGTNILYGDNAQGKTNVLEALEVCATTRTHRGKHESEVIRFGEEDAHLRLFFRKKNISRKIDIHIRRSDKKGAALDGVPVRKAADIYGQIHIVSFFPEDLGMIKNSPKERRRFLDSQLCQLNSGYVLQLTEYNKIIRQRNALLKDVRYGDQIDAVLDIWDEKMISCGSFVIRQREEFLKKLNVLVKEIHEEITDGKEDMQLVYEPDSSADLLKDKILKNREKDLRWKQSTAGPHKDDFKVEVNGMDLRQYGSQGQQRSAALSIKIAEIALVREQTGDDPILLLDDVLSELDSRRQKKLLQCIEKTQTFLTCTGMDELIGHSFRVDKAFHIREGHITGS
ncbi:MAG: DNA replication/repair protein RecF [Eubacterium sp.]|nr:DNA replication/repair protein RecF [Eubacterium sp.]